MGRCKRERCSEEVPESLSDYRAVKVIEGRPRSGKQFLILQKVGD